MLFFCLNKWKFERKLISVFKKIIIYCIINVTFLPILYINFFFISYKTNETNACIHYDANLLQNMKYYKSYKKDNDVW